MILEDTSSIDTLFDYLTSNLPEVTSARNQADFQDEGSLEYVFYPNLLIDIHSKERTGILSISSDADLKIYFRNGSPVYAEGGDRETSIGRILLNSGRITPEIHREVFEKTRERKNRIGEVLIDMGIISPHELNSYLELQTEEKILRGFCYISGEYGFSNEARFPDSIVEYKIKLPKVLNEAVKRFIYAEEIEERNPRIKMQGEPEGYINTMELKPRELRTVQLLKNNMSIKEILDTARLEKYETLKLLYFLGLFKVIELQGVSLDSLGRKSVQRYISEKAIFAADSEARHTTKDREELIELGGYGSGEEVTDGPAPGTAQTDTALPGASQESDSGVSTDAPAYESIDTEKNPFSEEIILHSHETDTGAGDAGEVEILIDAENEGLNALEPGGDGAPGGGEIDPGEFSEGGEVRTWGTG